MALIKNWGFEWQRKHIFRGSGGAGNAGHLKGYSQEKPDADFTEQIGVYVLYDWNERIVYVGQAGNGNAPLFTRIKQHVDGRLAGRWEYFTWFGFLAVNNSGSLSAKAAVESAVSGFTYSQGLNELEGILIEIIEPSFNKQAGKLKEATEYTQYIDDKMKEVSNEELYKSLSEIQNRLDKIGG
jgi:hypothetical protein